MDTEPSSPSSCFASRAARRQVPSRPPAPAPSVCVHASQDAGGQAVSPVKSSPRGAAPSGSRWGRQAAAASRAAAFRGESPVCVSLWFPSPVLPRYSICTRSPSRAEGHRHHGALGPTSLQAAPKHLAGAGGRAGLWEAHGIPQPRSDLGPGPPAEWAPPQWEDPPPCGPARSRHALPTREGNPGARFSVLSRGSPALKGADTVGEKWLLRDSVFELYILLRALKPPRVSLGLVIFASIYLFWSKGLNQSS